MVHTLLILAMAGHIMSPPVASVKELPLTQGDIRLIKAGGGSSIATTSTENQSCLLTPASTTGNGAGSGCTWRTEKTCEKTKTLKTVPVYSQGCVEEENSVVANCIHKVRMVPVVHKTQVCSIQGSKDCLGPCYNCPMFCKKTQQSVCETSHRVTKQVITRREYETDTLEGPREVLIKEEREVIKPVEDCHNEEIQELCAPVNCKFVNLTNTCKEKNSTMLVELREKHCTMCEAVMAETEEVKNVCQEVLTDECNSEPLDKPWKKFCSGKQDDMKKFVEDRKISYAQEKPRSQDITAKQVFLFDNFDSEILNSRAILKKESRNEEKPIVKGDTNKLSEVEKELIKVVKSEEELIHEEFDLIKNKLGLSCAKLRFSCASQLSFNGRLNP